MTIKTNPDARDLVDEPAVAETLRRMSRYAPATWLATSPAADALAELIENVHGDLTAAHQTLDRTEAELSELGSVRQRANSSGPALYEVADRRDEPGWRNRQTSTVLAAVHDAWIAREDAYKQLAAATKRLQSGLDQIADRDDVRVWAAERAANELDAAEAAWQTVLEHLNRAQSAASASNDTGIAVDGLPTGCGYCGRPIPSIDDVLDADAYRARTGHNPTHS